MNQEAYDLMVATNIAPCGCRVEFNKPGETPGHTCFHDENCALIPKTVKAAVKAER